MKYIFLTILLGFAAGPIAGQEPTELYDCVDDATGPSFCSDSTATLVDAGCGTTFNRYHGNIAWPVLRNVGPVTISVKTRYLPFAGAQLPLYVEVRGRTEVEDPKDCRTGLGGLLILIAQGGPACGGVWESVGPIDLAQFGVPLGELYNVQAVFFESLPSPAFPGRYLFHSIGFSCIRITSHPLAVTAARWSAVKALYR